MFDRLKASYLNVKLKLTTVTGKVIYLLIGLSLAIWAVMYLYFLSGIQIPLKLNDYEKELRIKEKRLRQTLIKTTILNPNSANLANIYELLSGNEICLGDFLAAEKHIQAELALARNNARSNKAELAISYLKNANFERDRNKFNLAKINYDCSLYYLNQIASSSNFNETEFDTTAVLFNNKAVLYFLMGQQTINPEQRQTYYLTARDYLVRARNLTHIINSKNNQCFRKNIDENLNQCLIEMQFSH